MAELLGCAITGLLGGDPVFFLENNDSPAGYGITGMASQSPLSISNSDNGFHDHLLLLDYFPLENLQLLQDTLAEINEVTFLTTDPDGNLLTMPSNEIRVCRLFRMSPLGEAACLANMQSVALSIKQGQGTQVCQSGCPLGLLYAAAPIFLDDIQVASLWIRMKCLCETSQKNRLDWSGFSGLDRDQLQSELAALKTCDSDDVEKAMEWLNSLSKQITQIGHQSLTLSRNAGLVNRLESELDQYKAQMEDLVNERTADLISANKRLQLEALERDLVEEQIARKSKLIDAINRVLQQTLTESGEQNLAQTFISAAMEITTSSFGFIVEKQNNQWTVMATMPCFMEGQTAVGEYSREVFDLSGIWKKVYDKGEPVFTHHPGEKIMLGALPKHFPVVENLLAVPLIKDSRALGLVALINGGHGYSQVDCDDIEDLARAFMGALMRKRMEMAKNQSEQRLNLAMDSANQGLWDYFPQRGQLYFSPSWFTMLGYHAHEFPTSMETWTTLTHPNDVAALEMALESVACGREERFGIEIRMLGKEGHWRWINAQGRAVEQGRDKAVVRIVGTLGDISKYKRVEMALQKANEELQRLAALDDLTQIANRRRFDDRLTQEWRRARRECKPLALVICDIDHFKSYNDTYGHLKGDDTLHVVAQTLSDLLKRPMDLVARFGGEEFAAILPNTNIKGAMRVAHEFKSAIDELNIEHKASGVCKYVTLSFGVTALIPKGDMQPKALIEAADKALYKAKALGRNTIVKLPGNLPDGDDTEDTQGEACVNGQA